MHEPIETNLRSLYAAKKCNGNWWSPIEMYGPDLEQYPEFTSNIPLYTTIKPGETLYTLDGWFHVRSTLGDKISITLTFFVSTDELISKLQL